MPQRNIALAASALAVALLLPACKQEADEGSPPATTAPQDDSAATPSEDAASSTPSVETGSMDAAAASSAKAQLDAATLPGEPVTGQPVVTDSGLMYYDLAAGNGPTPADVRSRVRVHYTGWLIDGTKFDSSHDRGSPAIFPLNGVIRAWTEGVSTMNVGGKRKLIVPANLAYGANGAVDRNPDGSPRTDADGSPIYDVPPNATIVFDVELLGLPDEMDYATVPAELPGLPVAGEAHENDRGVIHYDLAVGNGEEINEPTLLIQATMKGYLTDGTPLFDTGGEPTEVQLGTTPIGLTDGVQGMRVGGARKIIIPSDLAFGATGQGPVPNNATLVFDIEVFGVIRYDVIPRPEDLPGEAVVGERVSTESGLMYYDLVVGDGPQPAGPDSEVTVHYTGWLHDGTKFDSSYDRDRPTTLVLGRFIPGWIEGVGSMRVGGKRKLIIPYTLAYKEQGMPPRIPGRATLIFDIELLGVRDAEVGPPGEDNPPE